jgi:hypothetical protein
MVLYDSRTETSFLEVLEKLMSWTWGSGGPRLGACSFNGGGGVGIIKRSATSSPSSISVFTAMRAHTIGRLRSLPSDFGGVRLEH